jgi:hypothetical protein
VTERLLWKTLRLVNRTCPSCGRPIAERNSTRCLYCEAEIPPDRQFTADEQAAKDQEVEEFQRFLLWRRLQDLKEQLPEVSIPPPSFDFNPGS